MSDDTVSVQKNPNCIWQMVSSDKKIMSMSAPIYNHVLSQIQMVTDTNYTLWLCATVHILEKERLLISYDLQCSTLLVIYCK